MPSAGRNVIKTAGILTLLGGILTAPTLANEYVSLKSAVFIERLGHTADGRIQRKIEPASMLTKGDRVVMIVEWQATRKGGNFLVTSPIPRSMMFLDSSNAKQQISIDGGHNWGTLGRLKIHDEWGTRLASPQDATHVRWQISSAEAAQGSGRVTYSALVR